MSGGAEWTGIHIKVGVSKVKLVARNSNSIKWSGVELSGVELLLKLK